MGSGHITSLHTTDTNRYVIPHIIYLDIASYIRYVISYFKPAKLMDFVTRNIRRALYWRKANFVSTGHGAATLRRWALTHDTLLHYAARHGAQHDATRYWFSSMDFTWDDGG